MGDFDDLKSKIQALLKAERPGDALQLHLNASSKLRDSIESRLLFSKILIELGRTVDAISELNSIASKWSSNPAAYGLLADLQRKQGQVSEALKTIETGVSRMRSPKSKAQLLQAYARHKSIDSAGMISARAAAPENAMAVHNACIVSMMKDEEDVVFAFLQHHFRLGFRNFVILENGSNDGTRSEIDRFALRQTDANVVVINDPVVGYYQDKKMDAAAAFAFHYSHCFERQWDWVFPLDADEFISTSDGSPCVRDILETITAGGAKVLVYYLCDRTSEDLQAVLQPGDDPFEKFPISTPFLRKPVPKVAFRWSAEAALHMGNHFVDGCAEHVGQVEVGARFGVAIAHFAMRGVPHVKRKFINGGRAYQQARDRERAGTRWKKAYAAFEQHGEQYFETYYANYVSDVIGLTRPKT